jgi:hypothetical protein
MLSLDANSKPIETLRLKPLSSSRTRNIPVIHSHLRKTEHTPIFDLTNPEHNKLHSTPARSERAFRDLLAQPHKQIRDLTPILTVNDHFLEWAQDERRLRRKSAEPSLTNILIEDNNQPVDLQKEHQRRDQLIQDYQEHMAGREVSSPTHPPPGVIEEVAYVHGQPVVTLMAPEIAQPVIPVVQTHGPLPQVFLSSGNVNIPPFFF